MHFNTGLEYTVSLSLLATTRTIDMTKGNAMRHIVMFAVPLFVGTLFQQAYNLVDTMIASYSLGDTAVAAIGSTSAIYSMIINFAGGLNNGYGIVIARAFGADDLPGVRKAAATMIKLNLGVAIALTVIVLPLLRPILHLLDTPEDIFDRAYTYILVILIGLIMTICYNMCAGFLRALGNSRVPLYFLILSCLINVCLDLLFMVALRMDVGGAAWATVIATAISALACGTYIIKRYKEFLPSGEEWKLTKKLVSEMFSAGISMGLMQSVFSLGSIILQKAINLLGTDVITAHTASRRIYEMIMMPLSTIGSANSTFVSQNLGAGHVMRIRRTLRRVMWLEAAWSLISLAIAWIGGGWLTELLLGTNDAGIIANAKLNLCIGTVFFLQKTMRNLLDITGMIMLQFRYVWKGVF